MTDSDVELMLKFQKGDLSAFEQLLNKYHKPVINTIYRLIGNPTNAEDLAQEVFLRVYNSQNTYKPKSKFTTWLYTITKNLALNKLRDQKPTLSIDTTITTNKGEITPQFTGPSDLSPQQNFELKELQTVVKQAINSLPTNQKIAVILRKYQDLSYQEIAQVMGCSQLAVKAYLHRAKQTLKKKLTPYIKPTENP